MIDFLISGFRLKLEVGSFVFAPTQTTQWLMDSVQIRPGCAVLDLGCGIGPVAIAAAKKGAREVYAVDAIEQACRYAQRNVERNGVADTVIVRRGDLFAPVGGRKFDVIIDDLSGIAEQPRGMSRGQPRPIPSEGGDGTEPTIRMLTGAPEYLETGGTLYYPVFDLANSHEIIAHADRIFDGGCQEISRRSIPCCAQFRPEMEDRQTLGDNRMLDCVTKETQRFWTLRMFRCQMALEVGEPRGPTHVADNFPSPALPALGGWGVDWHEDRTNG